MQRRPAARRAQHRARALAVLTACLLAAAPVAAEPAVTPDAPVTTASELPLPSGGADDLIEAHHPPPLPAWDSAVDFTALRLAYARRRDYDARCEGTPAAEFSPAIDAGRFADAAAVAERWLARCPVDARVHQWAASAYYQAGMQPEFEVHARWHEGLVKSVLAGADGLSQATPWRVIASMEAYIALQYLELKPVQQSIIEGDPPLDRIDVRDAAGTAGTRYFDARWQLRRLRGLSDAITQ